MGLNISCAEAEKCQYTKPATAATKLSIQLSLRKFPKSFFFRFSLCLVNARNERPKFAEKIMPEIANSEVPNPIIPRPLAPNKEAVKRKTRNPLKAK